MLRRSIVVPTVLAWLAWSAPAAGAEERRYPGRVITAAESAGAIVVEGMGPWQVKNGVTQVEHRRFVVTSSTEWVKLERAPGIAPSGWTRDFVEEALPRWQVKPGDWVIVTFESTAGRPTALKIQRWEPPGAEP